MADLDGWVGVVVGGTRGIGRAAARELATEGATVIVTGRTASSAEAAARSLSQETAGTVSGLPIDVTDPQAVDAAFRRVSADYGRLDALVVSAGEMQVAPLGMIRPDDVQRIIAVNVAGTLYCLQAGSRAMMRKRSGSIILMGSIVGECGAAGQSVYAATKGAVTAMTKSAAKELGRFGIRVNAVAPGIIATDMTAGLDKALLDQRVGETALGRLGAPEDVGSVIVFLASPSASFVTGQVIRVDGGLVL